MEASKTSRSRSALWILGVVFALGASARTAAAQWTVVRLQPAGARESRAYGVRGSQQVGEVDGRACLWSGSSASWVDLHPADASSSSAYALHGAQQVGVVGSRAGLWSGSPASWVDLHPAGAGGNGSSVLAVHAGTQAGFAYFGAQARAGLWSGTPGSWLDLHPLGAGDSYLYAVEAGRQAGLTRFGDSIRAGRWNGTAASWVDLHPAGAIHSAAHALSGGTQVGYAVFGTTLCAGLWRGTSASWTNLHPPTASHSVLYGASSGLQVGHVREGGVHGASVWRGTAASRFNLHAVLPPEFGASEARGVWLDGALAYVVGWVADTTTGRNEAVMWIGASMLEPEPAILDLAAAVRALVDEGVALPGAGAPLLATLNAALGALRRGNTAGAIGSLTAFVHQVQVLVLRGVLTEEQGQALVDLAQAILVELGG